MPYTPIRHCAYATLFQPHVLPFDCGPCNEQRCSNMYSLCGELYTVKPKDHRFVQINEMTEKKKETKLFIYVIKTSQISLSGTLYPPILQVSIFMQCLTVRIISVALMFYDLGHVVVQ
jgi:hypothetical protein